MQKIPISTDPVALTNICSNEILRTSVIVSNVLGNMKLASTKTSFKYADLWGLNDLMPEKNKNVAVPNKIVEIFR